ncbi:multidrug resistance protein MdtO [Serratia marcescens]|nr:multidrug resistance protein MdtO [Serratia marcescens]
MRAFATPGSTQSSLFNFLQRELRTFPGRYNAMLRYLLSSVIVIIISMTLNVPMLSYSVLIVFVGTQQNIVLTRSVFPLVMLANTIAVGYAILMLKFTIDYPMIRLLFSAISLILLLYFMRAAKKMGAIFFVVAITVIYAQSFVDNMSNGEMLLRSLLWMWVAGGYAIVVTFIVDTLVLPAEPVKQLKQEMERILTVVSRMLDVTASGKPVKTLRGEEIQDSVLTLHKYLKFSVMRDAHYRENEDRHLAQVATVERLYSATRDLNRLASSVLSPAVITHCHLLSKACQEFLQSVLNDEVYHLQLQDKQAIMALPSCLRDMYSALISISLLTAHDERKMLSVEVATSVEPRIKRGLSYEYIKYGVKTLFSVAICYVFYTSTQWSGIHTSMLTCLIVALPAQGAAIRKSMLRIGGCLVGSAIALFATVFLLPHLDTITGLLLLVTPVLALSGWVAAGSERSSYSGMQIMLAFSLAMFTDFAPSPELPEIRDRVIGILLGIMVSTLVNSLIWSESEGKILRESLAGLFTYFAEKMSPLTLNKNAQGIGWAKLDATQKLLVQVALEPNWRNNDNEQLVLNCQILLGKLRELHITLYRLETEYALAISRGAQSVLFSLIDSIMQKLATDMGAYGKGIQNEPVISLSIGSKLNNKVQAPQVGSSVERLAAWERSLLLQTEEVITICHSIPAWSAGEA